MRRAFFVWGFLQLAIASMAHAAGPFGSIHVGNWIGGAFSDDNTGAFSHCAATSSYASGVSLVVGQNASNAWLLSFASPAFRLTKGDTLPVDVTFDGQSQARLFATANSNIMATAILPPNVARTFQKSSLMVAVAGGTPLQFNLTSTGPLLSVLATCVSKVKAEGLNSAGDFAAPKAVAAKSDAPNGAPAGPKSGRTGSQTGTGFVISANGHVVTNHHVIDGCTGDIHGNLSGEPAATLRVVSRGDASNDLACRAGGLVQELCRRSAIARSAPAIQCRDRLSYHGLLTSDFTVTTDEFAERDNERTRAICRSAPRSSREIAEDRCSIRRASSSAWSP